MSSTPDRPQRAEPIRVFLVDDHPVVRRGLAAVLEDESDIRVAGEAEGVQEAEQRIEKLRPDVLLVDLNLGHADGMQLLEYVRDRWVGMKTVVVTQHAPALYADDAREAGAMGFVCKDEAAEHVVEAVRAANRGDSYLSPRAHALK